MPWTPTRDAALSALDAFLPRAGSHYSKQRNHDEGWDDGTPETDGPQRRRNVSGLSPWLARRTLTEAEVVAAALAAHGRGNATKFIEEVMWRTYWKGWLAQRPSVWDDYEALRDADRARLDAQPGRRLAYGRALESATGIDCFDHWRHELGTTGYLHNHARMWFASVWIFTLRLPWTLGAALFERELLDADPASNTLSWRWVAGLHTRGKHYVARASNIATCTGGRFAPHGKLDESPEPLREDTEHPIVALPQPKPLDPGPRTGVLVTTDDLHLESSGLLGLDPVAIAGGRASERDDATRFSAASRAFDVAALDDGLHRAARQAGLDAHRLPDGERWLDAVVAWAREASLDRVVTMAPHVGTWEPALERLGSALRHHDIALAHGHRDWDRMLYPHATRGFFKLKKQLPAVIASVA
ncbi:MAG: FAD-binding domain-containing protein [Myxococcota bacterium]